MLRQANAGKAAALNRGLSAARHDIVVMVDADTVFEPDTVGRIVAPFADHAVGAASGNTKVGNRRGLLGRWQHIEYVMGFNLDRRLYDVLRCMPTVPGAIGAFRRAALDDVGGVSNATLAEDTDLTIALGRTGWRVVYVEDARAWTEAPTTVGDLWRQRYRWSYGTMQAVWKHRSAVWHHGEQAIGRRGLPYLVCFQIALPSIAPLIDLFAIYGLVFLDPLPVLGYWIAFNALQLGLGFYAFHLDRESPRVLWVMPLQQFVYRQLMYLVVLESLASALTGVRLRWHSLDRTGQVKVETARQNSAVSGKRACVDAPGCHSGSSSADSSPRLVTGSDLPKSVRLPVSAARARRRLAVDLGRSRGRRAGRSSVANGVRYTHEVRAPSAADNAASQTTVAVSVAGGPDAAPPGPTARTPPSRRARRRRQLIAEPAPGPPSRARPTWGPGARYYDLRSA